MRQPPKTSSTLDAMAFPVGNHRPPSLWAALWPGPPDTDLARTLAHQQKERPLHFDSPTQLLDYFRSHQRRRSLPPNPSGFSGASPSIKTDPARVLIHDDQYPVSQQHCRCAAKEVRAPDTVLNVTEEGQPTRTAWRLAWVRNAWPGRADRSEIPPHRWSFTTSRMTLAERRINWSAQTRNAPRHRRTRQPGKIAGSMYRSVPDRAACPMKPSGTPDGLDQPDYARSLRGRSNNCRRSRPVPPSSCPRPPNHH